MSVQRTESVKREDGSDDKILVLKYEGDPHDQVCMAGLSLGTSRTSLGRADNPD